MMGISTTKFIWHWRVQINWQFQWVSSSEITRILARVFIRSKLPLRHAFWRRAREKANIQNNTRKYDSMTSAQYEHRYCMKCGESNHDTTNCFHKEAIECSDCHRFGHKSKWCRYYNWRVGQGRRSELRHVEASSFESQKSHLGVVQSNYECLTLGHLNIRSLLPKIDEIRDLMATSNFDIFAVCESWLNDTVLDSEIAIEGYQIYRKDRSNSIGGGVCLYVKNEYAFTVCHDLMFNDVEALWGVLNLDSKRLLISVI